MNQNAAKLLMAMVILTRSSAFIFSKFAMEELSPFQALQAGTAFLDLSGPVQQFPDGRQQVLPFQSQLHTLGTALEQGQSQFPFQSVQYPGKT